MGYKLTLKRSNRNFYCFTHIYSYWQANYIIQTLAFKREFHAIIHPFRKIIIHTWQGISCPLYLHIYLHTIEKHFPRYLGAKYQSWGRTISSKKLSQASPNFHAFLILKPNFGFLAMSMFSCIKAKKFGFLSLKLHVGTYFESPMLSLLT